MSGGTPAVMEKVMAIRRNEFEAGLTRIAGSAPRAVGANAYVMSSMDTGRVSVRFGFQELPPAVLGGLLKLPRVRVTIDMSELDAADREDFVALFDRTFQRGGG